MQLAFRKANPGDFDYCASLYFSWAGDVIRDLSLDMGAQVANFRERWKPAEVRVITLDGSDTGWLQSRDEEGALYLVQLFVEQAVQRQGNGTWVLRRLFDEASTRPVTLGVVKSNPARFLYERMGFRTTHEDDRKFYMRREPDTHVRCTP